MNKRVFVRGGAFVASAAFLAASLCEGALAASKVELAKNIDDFSFKTVAYKTEATTDGGYVVGGKTIVCVKSQLPEMTIKSTTTEAVSDSSLYTIVDIEKCTEIQQAAEIDTPITPPAEARSVDNLGTEGQAVEDNADEGTEGQAVEDNADEDAEGGADDDSENDNDDEIEAEQVNMTILFDELCNPKSAAYMSEKKLTVKDDDLASYNFQCVDYMAKYTSAGKSVWATPIFDNHDILGVGETSTDYRLMTVNGDVYTFTKDKGEMGSLHLQYEGEDLNYVFDEEGDIIVNNDGTLIVSDDEGLALFDKSGDFVRAFEPDDGWEYDSFSNYVSDSVSVSGGKILMIREKEDDSEIGYKAEIVEVSKDLKTVKKRLSGISGSIESGKATMRYPMGGNKNGDMIVLAGTITQPKDSEKSTTSFRYESYDKDNKLIGTYDMGNEVTKVFMNGYVAYSVDGLFGGHGDDIADIDEAEKKAQDSDNGSKKLEFYTRTLEYIGSYQIASSEDINDYTVLNNGTLVAVGATQEETSPNGLRAHLAGKKDVSPANPSTFDNIQLVAILSVVAVLGAAALTHKKLARR